MRVPLHGASYLAFHQWTLGIEIGWSKELGAVAKTCISVFVFRTIYLLIPACSKVIYTEGALLIKII